MLVRAATVGGPALLAAVVCLFLGTQGASAAWESATNTTAFTCVPGGGALDFSDAHCDNRVNEGTGSFGHSAIQTYVTTLTETSNTQTANGTTAAQPFILKTTVLGAALTITCSRVEPDGTLPHIENKEPVGTHQVEGTVAVNLTECVVTGAGKGCQVGPATFVADVHGVEEPLTGGMALEFRPHLGLTEFVVFQFSGVGCFLKEIPVKGAIRATSSGATGGGATLEFKSADEELTAASNAASIEAKLTMKMSGGNPITLTTVT